MEHIINTLLEKIARATSLEKAQAYAECAQLIRTDGQLVDLVLEGCQPGHTIDTIKAVRECFGIGLKEAKEHTEEGFIFPRLTRTNAEAALAKIKAAGGLARLQ